MQKFLSKEFQYYSRITCKYDHTNEKGNTGKEHNKRRKSVI